MTSHLAADSWLDYNAASHPRSTEVQGKWDLMKDPTPTSGRFSTKFVGQKGLSGRFFPNSSWPWISTDVQLETTAGRLGHP
jgi:hypothetical protein